MHQQIPSTWVAVLDSSRATVYRLHHRADGHRQLDVVQPPSQSGLHAHVHDVVSDSAGSDNGGLIGARRHTFEPAHDPHKQEKHNFVQSVVDMLQQALQDRGFERLVIVAPERTIGEFRTLAPAGLKKAVWREIGKDLVHLPMPALWDHISGALLDPAPPAS